MAQAIDGGAGIFVAARVNVTACSFAQNTVRVAACTAARCARCGDAPLLPLPVSHTPSTVPLAKMYKVRLAYVVCPNMHRCRSGQ